MRIKKNKINLICRNLLLFILSLSLLFIPYGGCRRDSSFFQSDFNIVFLADTHISNDTHKDTLVMKWVDTINNGDHPGADLIIHLGDVVSSIWDKTGGEDQAHNTHRLGKADSIFRKLEIPYYFTMGNHDYKSHSDRDSDTFFPEEEILEMEKHWKTITGFDPYYSFIHEGWKFIILNSMRGRFLGRHFDETQLDWLEQELKDPLPAILCSHYPLKTDHFRIWCKPKALITPQKESRFFEIIEAHKHHIRGIFVGHGHMFVHDRLFGTIPVYEVDSFEDGGKGGHCVVGFNQSRREVFLQKAKLLN